MRSYSPFPSLITIHHSQHNVAVWLPPSDLSFPAFSSLSTHGNGVLISLLPHSHCPRREACADVIGEEETRNRACVGQSFFCPLSFQGLLLFRSHMSVWLPPLEHCTVNLGLGLQFQDFLWLNMSFKILHFSDSYVSQLHFISGTEERAPLPPRAFVRMILISLFVYHLWVSVCPTTSLFCPTESCILWRRSCVFFTIIFLVSTIEPGREWSVRKWLFIEPPEKAAPFYRNGQRGIKRAATSDRRCPKRSPWCSEAQNKIDFLAFYRKKKNHHFLKNYKWILFIMWQQTASVYEKGTRRPTESKHELSQTENVICGLRSEFSLTVHLSLWFTDYGT